MLALAVFKKNINNVNIRKKVLLSFTLVVMMVLSGFMGVFFYMDNTLVAGDDVGAAYGTANYTYYENYDDEVEGSHATSEEWYTFGNLTTALPASNYGDVDTAQYNTSPNSYLWNKGAGLGTGGVFYNFTTGVDLDYINFHYRITSSNADCEIRVMYGSALPTEGSPWPHVVLFLILEDNNGGKFKYNNGASNIEVFSVSDNTWYNITVILNYTTDYIGIYKDSVLVGWYDNGRSLVANQSINKIYIGSGNGYATYCNVDGVEIGTRQNLTDEQEVSINDTAFQNSMSLVGGQYCFTFSGSANTTQWSNTSGSGSETMNISIIDGTHNITWINVSIYDVTDGNPGHVLDAEDFTLYVSASPTTGFFNISTFPAGGGNITVNYTTWNDAGGANNPFNVDNGITGDDSIYFRIRLDIDLGEYVNTYDEEAASCGVWIGG